MPFKDSPEGQTHYENDGCGMPEHNVQKETCNECGNVFENYHWRYGQRGKMYHTNCLSKDNTRPLAMVKQAVEEVIQECIDLSEKIEREADTTEFGEWKTFKRFRNNLRDK